MQQYHALLRRILDEGVRREDRTGTGTLSVFGHQMRFDLSPLASPSAGSPAEPGSPLHFPLLTTKKLHLRSIIYELLWFLRGETNVRWLQEHGVSIWNEWADPETGELGPVYGKQWRSWAAVPKTPGGEPRTIDQISGVLHALRHSPFSRRHIVTAWNPGDVDDMALPPCHCLFQFYVAPAPEADPDPRPRLSCQLYQRSADVFLGVPFNIASYALFTQIVAHVLNYRPGEFIHTFGDAHLYLNHLEQTELQLSREPRPGPMMRINPNATDLFGFRFEDFTLENYDPHPHIKAAVSV